MGISLLTINQFRLRTIMPASDVDGLEANPDTAGWLQNELEETTAYIHARLKKRYATPFDPASPPLCAVRWLKDIVTKKAYDKRGHNATSEQDHDAIEKPFDTACAELKEAADSETGLFDLPLREDVPGGSGVSQGGPIAYSEASPYDAMDRQREAVRGE